MSVNPSQVSNPFSSSRVDTPFQDHLDLTEIYSSEYKHLKSILIDIKNDPNHQSKGAVVIGDAGSGKTHLMMRLAKEFLRTNRLLFIRQPNHAASVLYHTYARVLESLAERVSGSNHTQLELLLANSFVRILEPITSTQKGKEIVLALQKNSLSLFQKLGAEETQKHASNWQYIERQINDWWTKRYTVGGYAPSILKGIIKYCRYTDPRKKELVRRWLAAAELESNEANEIGLEDWRDELSREEFSLEAISVFGKLSTLDEPLIIIFDQLEGLGLAYNIPILESFGAAIKEILTHVPNSLIILNLFPDRWEQFRSFFDGSVVDRVSQYEIRLNHLSLTELEQILCLKMRSVGLELEQLFHRTEIDDILSQPSIRSVLNRASLYFRHKSDNIPLPPSQMPETDINSLTSRVRQLEQVLQQVYKSILPFVSNPIVVDSEKVDRGLIVSSAVATTEVMAALVQSNTNLPLVAEVPPLVIPASQLILEYLDRQQLVLRKKYSEPGIISDADDVGKLEAIAEAFKSISPLKISKLNPGKSKLPLHLLIKNPRGNFAVGFLNAGGSSFTAGIKNFNELVATHSHIQFTLFRDRREPPISGKVGKDEILKLNSTKNGHYYVMGMDNRIKFELIYSLITAILEKDIEVKLVEALRKLCEQMKEYWLIEILSPSK